MKMILIVMSLLLTSTAFADIKARVLCGAGSSQMQSEAFRKANDDLNRKLKLGVTGVTSVSDPKVADDFEKNSTVHICVTVVAESFSDLVL